MAILSYRDLRVWQAGMDLVEEVYRLRSRLPEREIDGLVNSMRRMAVTIPSSIAQGHTLEGSKDYLYHLSRAQGALADLQTQFEICGRLKYLDEEQVEQVLDRAVHLSRQMYALRNALLNRD